MPLINNSSGFQIHDGHFYVSGDVILETHQHLTVIQEQRPHGTGVGGPGGRILALDDGWAEGSSRELLEAARNPRDGMGAKRALYDVSDRPHLLATASHPHDRPESSPRRLPSPSEREVPDQRADSLGGESSYRGPLDHFQTEIPRSIHGRTFISAEHINHRRGAEGIHILHRAVALDALYDSAESYPQPKCHPETRKEMLDDLYNWAIANDSGSSIFWLQGPAGAGKSTIIFFFERGHPTRGNAKVLFATLAYQLALSHHHLKPLISRVVELDPSVMGRHMGVQLRKLVVEPFQLLNDSMSQAILLLDGLDECEGNSVQPEILRLLGNIAQEHHFPLRILIASGPEPPIRETFAKSSFQGLYDSVEIEQSFTDVGNYLATNLIESIANIMKPWPPDFRPTQRLAVVVQNLPTERGGSPYPALDKLYSQILPVLPATRINIEQLLGLNPGDLGLALRRLHSLLLVPSSEIDSISLHHKSFRDFLDPDRSGKFYIGIENLARSVLRALSQSSACVPSTHVTWSISSSRLNLITSAIPLSTDLSSLLQTVNPDFTQRVTLSSHNPPDFSSNSSGLRPSLLYIRLSLDMAWDELRAAIRPLRSLFGEALNELGFLGEAAGKSILALLDYAIQNTTICPEPYPWPTICRDLARGCFRLLERADPRVSELQRISTYTGASSSDYLRIASTY
ncbi:hypothetical protein DFH09DRAFT_1464110 [Mycena vulgaris]|nr:hypothetical protein DFH09DRAFT_1464110 [Mycena vulgaris]